MSGISIISSKEVYDPDMLKRLSDHTKGPASAPSSRFMTPEQVAAHLDNVREEQIKWDKQLIASGAMNADGSWNDGPTSAEDVFLDHQRTINRVQGSISIIENLKDSLPNGHNESAAYVEAFTRVVEDAKLNLERTSIYAANRQGLNGQLFTKDSEGNYKVGAFVLTSSSTGGVLRTGSNGDTQISNGKGEFTAYALTSVSGPAEPPLDIRA